MSKCISCIYWDRGGERPGSRPGVRDNYRKCGRPKLVEEVPEWRSPTDWCNQFTQREVLVLTEEQRTP